MKDGSTTTCIVVTHFFRGKFRCLTSKGANFVVSYQRRDDLGRRMVAVGKICPLMNIAVCFLRRCNRSR
jgi:hypothetical protein